jgi:hypothetical protein
MDSTLRSYEVRYGWHGQIVRTAWVSLVILGIAFLQNSLWVTLLLGFLGALGLLVVALTAPKRGIAFRVGVEGVTLGGPRLSWFVKNAEVTIPWSEVVSIVLWTERARNNWGRMSFIGVELRELSAQAGGFGRIAAQGDQPVPALGRSGQDRAGDPCDHRMAAEPDPARVRSPVLRTRGGPHCVRQMNR